MTTMVGGNDIVQLAADIANMYAANQAALYGMSGYYDPYSLGWASSPGTQVPTLARDQLSAQVNQWGVQNAFDQRQLDAQIAQWATQNKLDAGTLTGFYNGLPTLAREQLAATIGIANADNFRQWAQMRGSQLLQQQAQDDQMRVAAADAKLNTLQLLAQQRGPTNFLAYNSLLNSLASPNLQATDPFGIAAALMKGVPDRTTVDLNAAWNAGVPGGGVPLPSMTAPAGSTTQQGAASAGSGGGGVSTFAPSPAPQSPAPASSPTAITGNQGSDQQFFDSTGWANTSPDIQNDFWRISKQMGGYAHGTDGIDWKTVLASRNDPAAWVGDVKREGDPNPELLINPTDAPFIIVPADELPPAMRKQAGMKNMNEPVAKKGAKAYAEGTGDGLDWRWILDGGGSGGYRKDNGGASIQPVPDNNWWPVNNPGRSPWGGGGNGGETPPASGSESTHPQPDKHGWVPGTVMGQETPDTPFRTPWGWVSQELGDWWSNGPQNQGRAGWAASRPALPDWAKPWEQYMGGGGGGGTSSPSIQPVPDQPGNDRAVGTPFGTVHTNPNDPYWSRLPDNYSQKGGTLPAFATGTYDTNTPFGNFGRFTPQQLVDSPLVKKLLGSQPTDLWQHYGGADTMTLPGTTTRLPGTINMAAFARMAPSERGMTQGIYETPRSMGGLGLDWQDIFQASTRAAPIGARFSNAGYGY